jgi:Nuclease-related domain/PhoH-like protein
VDEMAKMIPESLMYYHPTESEALLLNKLHEGLNDNYTIFYSIRWDSEEDGDSECDILIFNPDLGILSIEVKGGKQIEIHDGTYYLTHSNGEKRILKQSPHSQAEASMRYFINRFEEMYNKKFSGIYGYCAAFPFYIVDSNILDHNATRSTTIDARDLGNINKKIEEVFIHFKNKASSELMLMKQDSVNMYNLINKSLVIGVLQSRHIERINKQIEDTTRMQETLINFISHYDQAIIIGGAGTGKSYLAYRKATLLIRENKKVLFITLNESLADEAFSKSIPLVENNHQFEGNYQFIDYNQSLDEKFSPDVIILDETQDLPKPYLLYLKEQYPSSSFYVFLDPHQSRSKMMDVKTVKDCLGIKSEPFVLYKNIRNTSNILNYLKDSFTDIELYANSFISGSNPISKYFYNEQSIASYINDLIYSLLNDEGVSPASITILHTFNVDGILKDLAFKFSHEIDSSLPTIIELEDFKGLENDVIIFLSQGEPSKYEKYLAYTRARYMLYKVVFYDF